MTISFKLTAEVSATVTQAPTPVLACWQFRVRKKPVEKNKLDGNMKTKVLESSQAGGWGSY